MEQKKVKIQIPREYSRILSNDWRHAVLEGGRYSLKSHTAARACILRARSRPMRIACLRQFQKNIGDSSYQLLLDLVGQYGLTDFTWTNDTIRNNATGSTFIFKGLERNVESTIKSLEGIDLAWIDEAQTITQKSLDVLIPTIRKKGSQIIWTMNRLTDLDPVLVKFITDPPRKDVWHLQTDYRIAKKNGWLTEEIAYEIEQMKKNSPEDYAHIYLGKALNQSDRSIMSVSAVLEAMSREGDDTGAVEVGVDVARMGNDRTVLVKRKGFREIDRVSYTHKRTTEVVDLIASFVNMDKSVLIKVDDTGVGGGVTDELLARGFNVMPINFGAAAKDKDKYPNLISEAWFYLASIIDKISISNDKDLLTELSTREWKMDARGRRGVESKEDYKKRGHRSPDLADATILAFYTPPKIDWAGGVVL